MRCQFCGKDWVQGCWDKQEAWRCGNNDGGIMPKLSPPPLPKRLHDQISKANAKLLGLLKQAEEYRAKQKD